MYLNNTHVLISADRMETSQLLYLDRSFNTVSHFLFGYTFVFNLLSIIIELFSAKQ